jgi:hypothetical protein
MTRDARRGHGARIGLLVTLLAPACGRPGSTENDDLRRWRARVPRRLFERLGLETDVPETR